MSEHVKQCRREKKSFTFACFFPYFFSKNFAGFLIEGFDKGHSGKDLFSYDDFGKILSKTIVSFKKGDH